jgi:kynurenine formamidase
MKMTFTWGKRSYQLDLNAPKDITIPLIPNQLGPNCYFAPPPSAEPVTSGDFVGSISAGSAVNFYNLHINPHGNGTHTECIGHIADGPYSIARALTKFHFRAQLISVLPEKKENGDRVISERHLAAIWTPEESVEALIIRTLPNADDKLERIYSGTSPPFLSEDAVQYIVNQGINHLLVDLPSIDPEEDEGRLYAHKCFFNFSGSPRTESTLTELIYVPEAIVDGKYILQLSVLRLGLDASPSRAVLYELHT